MVVYHDISLPRLRNRDGDEERCIPECNKDVGGAFDGCVYRCSGMGRDLDTVNCTMLLDNQGDCFGENKRRS